MKKVLILLVLGLIMGVVGYGQGSFVRLYDSSLPQSNFNDMVTLNNGNYVCVGDFLPTGSSSNHALVVIYNSLGQVIKEIRDVNPSAKKMLVKTKDGGFIVSGLETTIGSSYNQTLVRHNSNGDTLWVKEFINPSGYGQLNVRLQTSDDGFILAGFTDSAQVNSNISILKINPQGDSLWTFNWGGPDLEYSFDIIQTPDNGFLLAGANNISVFPNVNNNPLVIKLDSTGNEEWVRTYNFKMQSGSRIIRNPIGGYTLVGTGMDIASNQVGVLFNINDTGDSLRLQATELTDNLFDVKLDSHGNFLVTGGSTFPDFLTNYILIAKYDPLLNLIWRQNYGGAFQYGGGRAIVIDSFAGIGICGIWNNHGFLMKADSTGFLNHSIIKGKMVGDYNNNCLDDNEYTIPNQTIEFETSIYSFYAHTDINGKFQVQVYDTGQVTINYHAPNHYWTYPVCLPSPILAIIPLTDTLNLDIFIEPLVDCPDLKVNLSTRGLRRCFQNTLTVEYCNNGTLPANNPYLEIETDPYLLVDSASIPWVSNTGNLYRFNLDTMGIGQCGSFNLFVTVDCNSTELGQTHCVSAHIYPDSICLPRDPAWDGSSVKVTGICDVGDTLDFKIQNVGASDMTSPSFFLIAEDNVMYQSGNFQLLSSDSLKYRFKGNGSTFTLVANQAEGHPGLSFPMVSIEGCGVNNQGTYSKGFVTQYPQDDQDGFVDILCLQNIGAYDPNDKRPEPLGLNDQGYINATQPLDYTVRFQNTGTDTAFTVIIRDTLSANLDITTLYLTGASHSYTFQIIGSNVLEWTFPNILLPDSNVNEPLSNGFVSFHIQQTDGNTPGTEIRNRAGIYFDFNPPVITNTTLNTIVEDYKTLFTFIQSPESKLQLGIYPNPNNGTFSLDFAAKPNANYEFVMYDLAGAKQFGQTLSGNAPYVLQPELPTGMYIYQLLENGVAVSIGKVLVNK